MAKYLVTGGSGFIGSNIVVALVARAQEVVVLDDLSSGKKANLESVLDRIQFIEGDICEPEAVAEAMAGVDYVLHLAAIPSVVASVDNPVATTRANCLGTLMVLLAARDAKVKRLVFASSSAIYGMSEKLPKDETMIPAPVSPYAASKITGEYYCKVCHTIYGVPAVALRYFNVFGPRQNPKSQYAAVVPAFVTAYLTGTPPTIYGDGEQSRDFTFVDNIVQANLRACESEKAIGQVMNVACGDRITVNQLDRTIARLLGREAIQPIRAEERPGDVKHSCADVSRMRELLDFDPPVSFEEGLHRTITWYQDHYKAP